MSRIPEIAAFILAGGKSSRMGTDKAFIPFDGRTLLGRALEVVSSVKGEIRIVGDPGKFGEFGQVVEDVFPGCGPLGGIHAALRSSSADLNLIVAVDMPFLTADLLCYLVERARNSAATVTVPHCRGRKQPLCAVYRRSFADFAENALREGRFKIDVLFANETTQVIGEEELKKKGFSGGMFHNLNTPEELAEAHSRRH